MELTIDQKKAVALATARMRAAKAKQPEGKSIGGYIKNWPIDTYETVKGIGEGIYAGGKKLVTDPVGAAGDIYNFANNAGVTAVGGIENAYNMAAPQNMQIERRPEMEMASQVGADLKDRYWDNLGNTLYEHPFQSAMDVSSLAYGGEGLAAKVLGKAALTTKTLGKVAEVTNPLNVVAKPVNMARGRLAEGKALRDMRDIAPSHEQVVARKNYIYNELENAGIQFDANAYNEMLQRVGNKLQSFGDRAPVSGSIFSDLVKKGSQQVKDGSRYGADGQPLMMNAPRSPSFRDLEDKLIEAKQILRIPDNAGPTVPTEKAAARAILDELSPFFDNGPLTTNGRIRADDVAAAAKEARDLARRHILARDLGNMERKSKWYLSGDESGLRNQVAAYGKKNEQSMTGPEVNAAQKVVRREGVHRLMTNAGSNLAQIAALGGLGYALGPFAVPVGIGVGAAARAGSAALTNRSVDRFMKTVLAGRQAQEAALLKSKRLPIRTKGLLLGAEGAGLLGGRRAP